ncbi:PLP-dependent aminotransferase family protein [Alicyclobacillus ferrooxydans]|nr:PLP-dependent aminotransferase family protein [Alicyclobacillus ferrooxydans]
MSLERMFTPSVREALKYEAPGAWMPNITNDCIRLHAGYPAPSIVPVAELSKSLQELLEVERDRPLQYSGSPRANSLLTLVETRMQQRGIDTNRNRTLITAGSAQAIDLVAQILLTRDTIVMVEAPTYMEALETLRNYTDAIISIPTDKDGLSTVELAKILEERALQNLPMPKLLYTIPSFHNPTGVTLPLERRRHLLQLAEEYHFLILEDDAYGELYFTEAPRTLKSLDEDGRVIYLGSLSKVIAPGLRVGWVTALPKLVDTVDRFKKDLSHPLTEAMVAAYLHRIDWINRIAELRRIYRGRRDTLLQAMAKTMPDEVSWVPPDGGYFVWVHTPGVDTLKMLPAALENGVSYVAGQHFYDLGRGGTQYLRLSFSYVDESEMAEGVRILATLIRGSSNPR